MNAVYPRTQGVKDLLALLGEHSASDMIMFGQQNAGHIIYVDVYCRLIALTNLDKMAFAILL